MTPPIVQQMQTPLHGASQTQEASCSGMQEPEAVQVPEILDEHIPPSTSQLAPVRIVQLPPEQTPAEHSELDVVQLCPSALTGIHNPSEEHFPI